MANKGEWSEIYVALTLLAYQKLNMGDENDDLNLNEWMDVLKVIRKETADRVVSYSCSDDNVNIDIFVNEDLSKTVPAADFRKMADKLKSDILNSRGRSFDVSNEVSTFLDQIEVRTLKARSKDKSDIFLDVRDPRASIERENIGFSVKSEFGHKPTLFNTGKASAAKYLICNNMNDDLMAEINSINDIHGHAAVGERCAKLRANECDLNFVGFENAVRAQCPAFEENLDLINPHLPIVIGYILSNHFMNGDTDVFVSDVTESVISENPCSINRPEIKYPYMMKAFLYAAYCGLTAGTLWDGKSTVNGGYITVKQSGEIIANYALESETFKNFLYSHGYFDYPDTSEGHGDYGYVYLQDGQYYFKLNFQIRLK